jgi:hypothetical protein
MVGVKTLLEMAVVLVIHHHVLVKNVQVMVVVQTLLLTDQVEHK